MGRAKKTGTDEMIKIVDSFFESNGNPAMMKCSNLEKYAESLGLEIKAYDFRRDKAVRQRMEDLIKSVTVEGAGCLVYRSIDIDAILNQNRTADKLRTCLMELNKSWQRIYENALAVSKKNKSLLSEIYYKKKQINTLCEERDQLQNELKAAKTANDLLTVRNNYLKRMMRENLYPAIANEILKKDHELLEVDTTVTKTAMANFSEAKAPMSFSNAVENDKRVFSHEDELLKRMHSQITEER